MDLNFGIILANRRVTDEWVFVSEGVVGARDGRRRRNGELLQAVHMDQPHGADAALPDILESEPDFGLLHGKVSWTPTYLLSSYWEYIIGD